MVHSINFFIFKNFETSIFFLKKIFNPIFVRFTLSGYSVPILVS